MPNCNECGKDFIALYKVDKCYKCQAKVLPKPKTTHKATRDATFGAKVAAAMEMLSNVEGLYVKKPRGHQRKVNGKTSRRLYDLIIKTSDTYAYPVSVGKWSARAMLALYHSEERGWYFLNRCWRRPSDRRRLRMRPDHPLPRRWKWHAPDVSTGEVCDCRACVDAAMFNAMLN